MGMSSECCHHPYFARFAILWKSNKLTWGGSSEKIRRVLGSQSYGGLMIQQRATPLPHLCKKKKKKNSNNTGSVNVPLKGFSKDRKEIP